MDHKLSVFLAPLILILILDYVWVGVIMKTQYLQMFADVQGKKVKMRYTSAALAYILMYFAFITIVLPLLQTKEARSNSPVHNALRYGALFGFFVYGIFNATNYALLENYDKTIAVADTLWGASLYGIVTFVVAKFVI